MSIPFHRVNRIARVCWNTNGWRFPSGLAGKSRDRQSFERDNGFGHEEWLLEIDKIINGYHYSFLQPIQNRSLSEAISEFNLVLITTNSENGQWYWLGKIDNVIVVEGEEAEQILQYYDELGWLDEMQRQVSAVGGRPINLNQPATNIINSKFRLTDLDLYENFPVPILSLDKIPGHRYQLFEYNERFTPDPDLNLFQTESFVPNNPINDVNQPNVISRTFRPEPREYLLLHQMIQNGLHRYLNQRYPNRTQREADAVAGNGRIDLKFQDDDGKYIYFEIKTYANILTSVRAALGQLIEYAFYPMRDDAKSLIIVSFVRPDQFLSQYLSYLSQKFNLPIGYIQFDCANSQIVSTINCRAF